MLSETLKQLGYLESSFSTMTRRAEVWKTGVSMNGALIPKWRGFLQISLSDSDHTWGFPADSSNGFTVWFLLLFSVWLGQFCHGGILLTDANTGQKRSSKWDAYKFCRTASYNNFPGSCLQFPDWLWFPSHCFDSFPFSNSERCICLEQSQSISSLQRTLNQVCGQCSGKAHPTEQQQS